MACLCLTPHMRDKNGEVTRYVKMLQQLLRLCLAGDGDAALLLECLKAHHVHRGKHREVNLRSCRRSRHRLCVNLDFKLIASSGTGNSSAATSSTRIDTCLLCLHRAKAVCLKVSCCPAAVLLLRQIHLVSRSGKMEPFVLQDSK